MSLNQDADVRCSSALHLRRHPYIAPHSTHCEVLPKLTRLAAQLVDCYGLGAGPASSAHHVDRTSQWL